MESLQRNLRGLGEQVQYREEFLCLPVGKTTVSLLSKLLLISSAQMDALECWAAWLLFFIDNMTRELFLFLFS